MSSDKTLRVVGWVTAIVAAELLAFTLLQKSVDSDAKRPALILGAMALFGVVVPLAFRETLREGSAVNVSNLYWILLSQSGAVLLDLLVFKKVIRGKDYISMGLLFASAGAAFLLPAAKE